MGASRGLGLVLELCPVSSLGGSGIVSNAAAIVIATLAAHGTKQALYPHELRASAYEVVLDGSDALHGSPLHKQAVIKHLKVKPRRVVSAFCPRNILFSVFKSALLPFGLLLDSWFDQVRAAEQLAELNDEDMVWPPFPKERVRPAAWAALYAFSRDMTTTVVRLAAQNWVWLHAPVEWANRLLKDFRASAVRKSVKQSWVVRPFRLAQTTFWATSISYASDCAVSIALETAIALFAKPPMGVEKSQFRRQRVWAIVRYNVMRCTLALGFSSAMVGLVTTLSPVGHPGWVANWTFLGADAYSQMVLVPTLVMGLL